MARGFAWEILTPFLKIQENRGVMLLIFSENFYSILGLLTLDTLETNSPGVIKDWVNVALGKG